LWAVISLNQKLHKNEFYKVSNFYEPTENSKCPIVEKTKDCLNWGTNLQNSVALVTFRAEFHVMQYDALQLALA